MPDRRLVLATLACALLLAGALLAPAALRGAAPEESLHASSVSGPIASAIDAGASASLAGLLPTGESYQRAAAVADGLKAGIPASPPSLSSAQLADVTALARGATAGVLAHAPTTPTGAPERAALAALAKGYLGGALDAMDGAPSAARAALDEALAKGVFAGATAAVLGEDSALSPAQHEQYARTLAAQTFDRLDADGQALAAALGSPALADVTLFATELAREQLASLPSSVARAQLDAVAAFGAGTLDGLAVAALEGFPRGAPAPAREDVKAYVRALATGHEGTPPWRSSDALPLLVAWADGVGAAGIEAIAQAHANASHAASPERATQLAAWAEGLATGGYDRLDAVAKAAPDAARDAEAYARAVAGPAARAIAERPQPNADPEAVAAWAAGLTGALDGFTPIAGGGARYLESYLGPLAEAAASIPPDVAPGQTQLLLEFGEGATKTLAMRLGNVSRVALADDDPALLESMATGLAEGALAIAGGPALSNPQLAQALGDGFASGFLDSKEPRAIWGDVDALLFATEEWFATGPPVSVQALYDAGLATARDPYNAVYEYGRTMGGAPVEWASNKGSGLDAEGWGGKDDLVWIASFGAQTALIVVPTLLQPDGSLNRTEIDEANASIHFYVQNVTGQLNRLNVSQARENVTTSGLPAHARRVAEHVLLPLEWLGSPGVPGEKEAALEMLRDTRENATWLRNFSDASYAQAILAFGHAMAEGVRDGGRAARENATDARPEGGFTAAWVKGVLEAFREVPKNATRDDVSARVQWLKAMSGAVPGVAGDATRDQRNATRDFAREAAAWALGAPGRVPEPTGFDTPLLAWANATVAEGLASLPPVMTPEEQNATVAYLQGIQEAVQAMPGLDIQNWSVLDVAGIEAYVGGISSGVANVANETRLLLCAEGAEDLCPSNGGGDCKEDDGCCPPGEDCCKDPKDCDPTCDDCEPEPCYECDLHNWTLDLHAWSQALVEGGLVQTDRTEPTLAGVEIVRVWAYTTLAGEGFCPAFEQPSLECDGPRGPLREFVQAREDDVAGFATSLSEGYGSLVQVPTDLATLTAPVTEPLLAYAAGLQNAMALGWLQPERFLPDEGGAPGSPVPTPENASEEALRAWSSSLWDAIPERFDEVWLEFPDTGPLDEGVAWTEYLYANVLWQGGAKAIFASARNATRVGENVTPDTGALDAFAAGLVGAIHASLVDPAATDTQALANWYVGVAEGGVGAILAFGGKVHDEQVPSIQEYAAYLATALQPPAPPLPITVGASVPEEDEASGETDGSGEDKEDEDAAPSARDAYLTNLQAHAAGIAEAALDVPLRTQDLADFHDATALYLEGILAAATALPPVSPDAGFPGRLQAWSAQGAAGALARSPTSPERVTADPDVELALAFLESFVGASAWNLEEEIAGREAWARTVVEEAIDTDCPVADAETCAAIGAALGEALGTTLPLEADDLPLPTEDARRELVRAVLDAAAPLFAQAPEAPSADAASGLVLGLLPAGVGAPVADDAAKAVADALAPHLARLPPGAAGIVAEETVEALLSADPDRYHALATGAVGAVLALGDAAKHPATTRQALEGYLTAGGDGKPTVTWTDGARTSERVLDGQQTIRVSVHPPASSSPVGSTWELRWSTSDPAGADARAKPLVEQPGGALVATFAPAELASLPRAASVKFLVAETRGAGTAMHAAAGGEAYAFVPDRDAPNATLAVGAREAGTLSLSWTGTDGDSSVASYRVEVRDDGGAWTEWLASTALTSATFSGEPGHAYAFRVTARDAAGHESAPAASDPVAIPGDAPAPRAPSVEFLAPAAGAVFSGPIPVTLRVSDPDGTTPVVRVCLVRERASVELACPYEGAPEAIHVDASGYGDGRYRLRAVATDGARSAEATSAVFALDRAPPSFRGAGADPSPGRVVLSAALDPDATSVVVEGAGAPIALADDGEGADAKAGDGIWTGATRLAPGEYALTFRARDAGGNEATLAKAVVVPAPRPVGQEPPGGSATAPPHAAPPAPTTPTGGEGEPPAKRTPPVGLAPLLVALVALALARRGYAKR